MYVCMYLYIHVRMYLVVSYYRLRNPPKKGLYMLAFDYWFSYDDHDPRVWCDILNCEVDRKVYFNNIYDSMLTKNESDLIWKIRHGATYNFISNKKIRRLLNIL